MSLKPLTILLFSLLIYSLPAQENWFQAQSDKATVKSIVSTSELVESQYQGKYLYPPINILDGNFDTTWCEAEEGGSGIGESITVELEEPLSFNEIQLVNGFASGNNYYSKNNRVAKMTLTQTAGQHFQQKQYTLEDNVEGWQSINFDFTQTAQVINIRIDEVFKGIAYDDTCLSEFRFLMDGKVIPFENVENIIRIQEQHSRLLLDKSEESFVTQFLAMAKHYGNSKRLYFREKGTEQGIFFNLEDVDFEEEILKPEVCRIHHLYDINAEDFLLKDLWYSSLVNNEGFLHVYLDNPLDSDQEFLDYALDNGYKYYAIESYGWNDPDYTLTNFKLLTHKTIDYVDVETLEILNPVGLEGMYINGVYYELLDDSLVISYYESP